jgi:uncharacterized SAM-binding protein YcdF (DUF218 family)
LPSESLRGYFALEGEERCLVGADLYQRGLTPLVIPTGEGINPTLEAMGMRIMDAEVGRHALLEMGVDSSAIRVLKQGTSTFEESEEILGYCRGQEFKRIAIISSKFHTRRIQGVFQDKFHAAGIEVMVRGADPLPDTYEIDQWWESESGLIFVNNEYMKLLYYALKY